MIWYDMIWYDMIWYDMIWYDMIWYDRASNFQELLGGRKIERETQEPTSGVQARL